MHGKVNIKLCSCLHRCKNPKKGGMLMANMHSEADRVAEIDVGHGGRRILALDIKLNYILYNQNESV